MALSIETAVSEFGRAAKSKLSNPAATGQPEDQLRAPFEKLLQDAASLCNFPPGAVVAVGETSQRELKTRPDYSVTVNKALVGFVELKAPGKGANPPRFKDPHDKAQWERLSSLPNLIYSDGNSFSLWQDGKLAGSVLALDGDIETSGAQIAPPPGLLLLFESFLRWRPIPPRSARELAHTSARLCRFLRDEVTEQLGLKSQALTDLAVDWRKLLFPDATDERFADGYAQAVTFGMLMARAKGIPLSDGLDKAAAELARSSTLIGAALRLLTDNAENQQTLKTSLGTLTRVLHEVDWKKVSRGEPEAWLYFYEEFLDVYDKKLRKETGSYYTPPQVVGAMVALVDEVLRSKRFGLHAGLASPQVTLVDPAVGTGTFLLGVLRRIAERVSADEGPGAVKGAIQGALSRLIGFEIQLGPFAVAQLRILAEIVDLTHSASDTPLRLFVTNTLGDPYENEDYFPSMLAALGRSRRDANKIKREEPITVVLGNPPYKEKAKGRGGWIEHASPNKKDPPPLQAWMPPAEWHAGAHSKHLHNLYVYFWRWATWKVFDQQPVHDTGIVCFISVAGFLAGPGFQKMRDYMRRTCDDIWVIDCSPEGHQPEVNTRIFQGVMQPVCIVMASRSKATKADSPASVHFRALPLGKREQKFEALSAMRLNDPDWIDAPSGWRARFLPASQGQWSEFPAIEELFIYNGSGVMPGRTWVIAPDAISLRQRWKTLIDAPFSKKDELLQPHLNHGKLGDSFLLLAFICVELGQGQYLNVQDTSTALGTVPQATTASGTYDTVNLADLGILITIPVRDKPGPTLFRYMLVGQATVAPKLVTTDSSGTPNGVEWSAPQLRMYGVSAAPLFASFAPSTSWPATCPNGTATTVYSNFILRDSSGASHPLPSSVKLDPVGCLYPSATGTTVDGSGYTATLPNQYIQGYIGNTPPPYSVTVTDRSGNTIVANYTPPVGHSILTTQISSTMSDPYGNIVTSDTGYSQTPDGSGVVDTYESLADPLGAGATWAVHDHIHETHYPASYSATYSYADASGTDQPVTVNEGTVLTAKESFGCSSVQDWTSLTTTNYPSTVTLPNNTQLSFSYEQTPGSSSAYTTSRLASITLPTGGQITYAYSGGTNGINCLDGTTNTLLRTTPDGTWRYVHNPPVGLIYSVNTVQILNNMMTINIPMSYSEPSFSVGQSVTFAGLDNASFLNGQSVTIASVTHRITSLFSNPFYFDTVITASFAHTNYGPLAQGRPAIVYSGNPTSTTTATDPQGNVAVYTFMGPYELQRQLYQGAALPANLLETQVTCYNQNFVNCASAVVTPPLTQKDVYTYFPGVAQPSLSESKYNSYGLVIDARTYDFTATVPPTGSPVKDTVTTYGSFNGSGCTAIGSYINDRVCTLKVKDGSGSTIAQTNYTYDAKGKLITESRLISGTSYVTRTYTYNSSNGALATATDWNGNQTTYTNTLCNNLLPSSIAAGGLTQSFTWDCSGGVKLTSMDENSQRTTHKYGDPLWRETEVDYADGGVSTTTYNDTASPPNVVTTQLLDSTHTIATQTTLDGLGRPIQSAMTSDPDGISYTVTSYDALGRMGKLYNATRCTTPTVNCGEPTWGYKTFGYDALDRATSVTQPDGSEILTAYTGNCSTVTDEAGKVRKSCVDGLRRLTGVWEDPSGLNYETDYSYDALGNLLSVTQKGGASSGSWRNRSFQYDSLSRLTQTTNPESGTVSYFYTTSSGGLCSGDTSAVCSKTALSPNQSSTGTATVTTTYTYDALNRLTGKNYSDTYTQNPATPSVTYGYDEVNLTCPTPIGLTGTNATNGLGRRTAMCYSAGNKSWAYDPRGRVKTENDRFIGLVAPFSGTVSTLNGVPTIGTNTSFVYYLNGDLENTYYPQPGIPGYEFYTNENAAGRVTTSGDSYYNVFFYATYAPHGALATASVGPSGTYNGNVVSNTYNNRLQPVLLSASTYSGTPILNLTYNFNLGNGTTGSDNSNVIQVANGKDSNRTQNFTYDALNRIQNAYTNGPNWGESYTTDAWGNMTAIGSYQGKPHESLNTSASTTNRLAAFVYDAAGNLIQSGSTSYTYDAENRLISTNANGGYSYIYDGDGERVEKCTKGTTPGSCASNGSGTFYWKVADGHTLAESDLGGNWTAVYGLIRGRIASRVDLPGNTIHYYFQDRLSSTGVITGPLGDIQKEVDYYPYGGEIPISGSDGNRYKFTGKERDVESNLDFFGARYYGSTMGRWMSPDWAARPAAVPYASFGNPQSLNLYSYVKNNPVTLTDADGHCDWCRTFLEKTKNAIEYGHYVTNADLNAALAADAQRDIQAMSNRGLYIDGVPAAQFLKGKSNKEVVDMWQEYKKQLFAGEVQTFTGAAPIQTQWGWSGQKAYNDAVRQLNEINTPEGTVNLREIGGKVPTQQEALRMIEDAGGKVNRMDVEGHGPDGVSTHDYPHINYYTSSGVRGTIQIQP